jgi:sulfite reductase (ferredoxin)
MPKKTLETFYKKAEASAQEQMKINSQYLKGDIAAELADTSLAEVSDYSYDMLKFHGTYQGYNRDTQLARKKQGLEKENEFMVRCRIPGGRLSAEQYIAFDDIATKYANNTLRATTRQTFQIHVVAKNDLQACIADINKAFLSTLSACGDVVRNVTTVPAPIKDFKHEKLIKVTEEIAEFIKPKTTAYDELWNGAATSNRDSDTTEPLYGITYLPRKFKIGVIIPEDNAIDVFTHDLGIILVYEGEKFIGYNIAVGGGMGMNHEAGKDEKQTYPRLATPLCLVREGCLHNAIEAIVKIQRDFGDRTDRKHARLKYVVEELGQDWFFEKFVEYYAATKPSANFEKYYPIAEYKIKNHLGWHEQGDGNWYLGIPTASGRIADYSEGIVLQSGYHANETAEFKNAKFKTAFREIAEKFAFNITVAADQKFILCDIPENKKAEVEALLKKYNIPLKEDVVPALQHFHTCVSLPTCAKALAESERVQFAMIEDIKAKLTKYNLQNEHIAIRVAGCPNGCSRPFVGDIGIVGRMPDHYVLFIGGDFEGTRLNTKVFDKVPLAHLGAALEPLFETYAANKNPHEGFGDFCTRYGIEKLIAEAEPKLNEYKWGKLAF